MGEWVYGEKRTTASIPSFPFSGLRFHPYTLSRSIPGACIPVAKMIMIRKPVARRLLPFAAFVGAALIFTVIYGISPLYTSNQNQYLLYGLARGGMGWLRNDWMANTTDPVPLFSWLVYLTYRFLSVDWFYVYFAAAVGIYIYALSRIVFILFDFSGSRLRQFSFFTGMALIHSGFLKTLIYEVSGKELLSLFYTGLAKQYVLAYEFQPSVFGVLLLLSIALFLQKRYRGAVVLAVLAAAFHTGSLFSAGGLVLAYMAAIYLEKRALWPALKPGLLALLLIAPVLFYVVIHFDPFTGEKLARAQHILNSFRTPHHLVTARWSTESFWARIAIIIAGLACAQGTRLFPVLALSTALAFLMTLLQILSGSDSLALIYPWRISVILVPLATALMVGRGIDMLFRRYADVTKRMAAPLLRLNIALLVLLLLGGAYTIYERFQAHANDPARGMLNYVKTHARPGDQYLIPSLELEQLENFRLETGAPALVDFKAVPYRDVDVLEWYERISLARRFYRAPTIDCSLLRQMHQTYRLTHLVLETERFSADCAFLAPVYQDEVYGVYEIGE